MERPTSYTFVMTALALALTGSSQPVAQSPTPPIGEEAQAIYAVLLPPMWDARSKGVLLLQRETVTPYPCVGTAIPFDAEWEALEKTYAANTRVQALPPTLRLGVPYQFVAQATIAAEDARLKRKYPGYNGLPGATPYAAVSAVGFNAARTRAIVYVRLRDGGEVYSMEKRDGVWAKAPRRVCVWRS
jgi:hypothetical protein